MITNETTLPFYEASRTGADCRSHEEKSSLYQKGEQKEHYPESGKKAHFMSIDEIAEKVLVMFRGNIITAHELLKVMEL